MSGCTARIATSLIAQAESKMDEWIASDLHVRASGSVSDGTFRYDAALSYQDPVVEEIDWAAEQDAEANPGLGAESSGARAE